MERAERVHNKLIEQKKRLVVAESCTGGLLMATLTTFSGASEYLLGGFVVYANELKESILQVSHNTLEVSGAVSEECVIEMVQGIFKATKADLAIAVSGIFGPFGGTKDKPIGTVWMAIGERNKAIRAERIPLKQDLTRLAYRKQVVDYLLEALWNQ